MEALQASGPVAASASSFPARLAERVVSLARARSPLAFLFFAISLAAYAALLFVVPEKAGTFEGPLVSSVYRGCVAALGALCVVMLAVSSAHSFHTAVAMHAVVSLLLPVVFRLPAASLLLLMIAGLIPLCIYERFPLSLCLAASYGAALVGAAALSGAAAGAALLPLAIVGASVSIAGSLMGRYWETVVELQRYITRLEDNVSSLTRATSLSQDYARGVEEESRVAERMRLTRDIHDAIGYTMTNTIMAMEAVKMMATTEPGRVGPYLEATRGNVEEGYAHIRQILRDFRSRERAQDTCYMAIKKLVNVFSLSTGLAVRFEFGNLDPALLDRFGECVYHFIQEGLINAFRHGRASKVTLLFWDFGEALRITLDDDGSGCAAAPVPGIGLNGMIERSTALEGKVAVERFTRGFRISMTLPKDVHAADD